MINLPGNSLRLSQGMFSTNTYKRLKKVVSDHASGLMWQQSGSSQTKNWAEAHDYVQEMNKGSYAGFSDWPLPTIEELASLLESVKKITIHSLCPAKSELLGTSREEGEI